MNGVQEVILQQLVLDPCYVSLHLTLQWPTLVTVMTNSHRWVNLSQTRTPSRACDHAHYYPHVQRPLFPQWFVDAPSSGPGVWVHCVPKPPSTATHTSHTHCSRRSLESNKLFRDKAAIHMLMPPSIVHDNNTTRQSRSSLHAVTTCAVVQGGKLLVMSQCFHLILSHR